MGLVYNKFRSILITHDIVNRVDFSYLAELFRFMGFFVCEDILLDTSERTEAEVHTRYDVKIYVGMPEVGLNEEKIPGLSAGQYNELFKKLPEETILWRGIIEQEAELGDTDTKYAGVHKLDAQVQLNVLYVLMERVIKTVFSATDQTAMKGQQLKGLIDIFVGQKLWLHSMNLQYYSKRASKIVTEAKQAFLKSYEQVKKVLADREEDSVQYIYRYALLWCEMKVNSACDFNGEILYFPIEKLAGECRNLCEEYPGFSNAKVLTGLCYEPSPNSANEALWAFFDALQDIQSESYASPVYYWMGRRYESYRKHQVIAEDNFKLANQRKNKFRNIFKLAIIKRDKQKYEEAIELFNMIPLKLSRKMEMRLADPLELEYLFKVYTQECYIYHKMQNYVKAIEVGEKAINIRDDAGLIDENQYFKVFYGEEEEEYRNLLKSRLNLSMVYWILVECYTQIFDMIKAEEYRKYALAIESKV